MEVEVLVKVIVELQVEETAIEEALVVRVVEAPIKEAAGGAAESLPDFFVNK